MSHHNKETTPKEMKTSGVIWKELSNSKMEKSFTELSKSKSKSKKFIPIRSSTVSHLHKTIKALKESKQNTASESTKLKDSEEKDALKRMPVGFPSKSEEFLGNPQKRRETPNNAHNQSNSSFMLMNQLSTLDKELKQKTDSKLHQTVSLQEQYQSMQDEIRKNKTDLVLFKNFVQAELFKHGEYLKIQFHKIYQILQNCAKPTVSEVQLNFSANEQGSHENNHEMETSLEISEIQKLESHFKNDCQQTFAHQSLTIDLDLSLNQKIEHYSNRKTLHKRNESQTLIERPRIKSDLQFSSTAAKQRSIKQESSVKSKRQFQKLFQAVDCLKQDIRELKNLRFALQEEPAVKTNKAKSTNLPSKTDSQNPAKKESDFSRNQD